MSETNVAERLKIFIEHKGLTYSQFADSCGIPRPSLSQLLTGRNKKINDIMVGQIHQTFPTLSIVWLLFGEGSMENTSLDTQAAQPEEENSNYPDSLFSADEFENSPSKKIFFSTEGKAKGENDKEKGLNRPSSVSHNVEVERDKWQNKIKEMQGQIDKMKKNPRKAVRIMVYYDDSTFEEFFPR